MNFPRASGLLLHPTSLPGRFGIGDVGPAAFEFVDTLKKAGQMYWQILPLTPTGYGDSPYSSASAFAGNTLLISPEKLVEDGLIDGDAIEQRPDFSDTHVDFGAVYEWKTHLLWQAFERFRTSDDHPLREDLAVFQAENGWWLDDYALFKAAKAANDQKPWYEWDEPLRLRRPEALEAARGQLAEAIDSERFSQFLFFRQWLALRDHANEQGIKIIGDVPIFVALDSADVWCNQSKFKLEPDGTPTVVSGVPPDYFSATGQLWGNPIYDWDALRADGFGWWIARMTCALRLVDIVRIDHFIGFARVWEVPFGDTTAENGEWVDVPGGELLMALAAALQDLPFIAEDLGAISPEVEELRDHFHLAGMRILQYGFGGDPHDLHLPHNYVRNCVAYTGTHDNETVAGWYKGADRATRRRCRKYLASSGRAINWDMIRGVLSSVADTGIIPVQDVLGFGNEGRMNTPAGWGPNWQWRLPGGDLNDELLGKLREMTDTYGRLS